jgi:hypothetical protein
MGIPTPNSMFSQPPPGYNMGKRPGLGFQLQHPQQQNQNFQQNMVKEINNNIFIKIYLNVESISVPTRWTG